jgi:hypothetical protein
MAQGDADQTMNPTTSSGRLDRNAPRHHPYVSFAQETGQRESGDGTICCSQVPVTLTPMKNFS